MPVHSTNAYAKNVSTRGRSSPTGCLQRKNLEVLLQTYAIDAEQFNLHGDLLAKGHEQLRSRFAARFLEPNLHAKLLSRIIVGNLVTDVELVTRNFSEGLGTLEMLCIYEVLDGRIQRASFAFGEKTLYSQA